MRKDVRLGLGVGGILFGVVLIYVLFFAGGNGADEFAGDLDSGASETTNADSSTGSAAESSKRTEGGATLVNTGSITGIGTTPTTPTTPVAGNNSNNNSITPPIAAGGPTTRPIGTVATGNLGAPTANTGSWNWRELVNHGARSGELLSRTETPTPSGARSMVEPRNIQNMQIDPPMGSSFVEAGPSTRPTGPRIHVVRSGESFWTIAKNEYGNPSYYSHLARANPKVDPSKLKAGMRITIPSKDDVVPRTIMTSTLMSGEPQTIDETRQYRVQKGDSLSMIAKKLYGRPDMADRIYQANRDVIGANPSALKLNAVLTLPETPTRTATAGTSY